MMKVLLCLLVSVSMVIGHNWGFGSCPTVPPYPNFSVNKFIGRWFVSAEFDTDSKCVTLDFTPISMTSLLITKNRQFPILDVAGMDHTSSYQGYLDIPLAENQAFMRLKWPLNLVGKSDFVVFDTDYETYAGIYDCQQLSSLMYRESASILSRTNSLEDIYVDRVIRRMKTFGIDSLHLQRVDQSNCRSSNDSSLKLDFNRYTITNFANRTATVVNDFASQVADEAANVANTVSNRTMEIYNTVSDGAMQVVNTVSDGVRTAADTVSSNVRRIGLIPPQA